MTIKITRRKIRTAPRRAPRPAPAGPEAALPGGVRYTGPIPARLRAFCDRHAHQIAEVHAGDGYCTESGFAYDVLLKTGWCDYCNPTCHTIIEPTLADVLAVLRGVEPCECDEECRAVHQK
jgi:hypothetical protein